MPSLQTAVVLTPFPYVTMAAFLIQSCITDSKGAAEGIKYFITPRWEQLADVSRLTSLHSYHRIHLVS